MSYFLRIFCKSYCEVSRNELIEFISDGVFFDEIPEYDPRQDSTEIFDSNWGRFIIYYQKELRPIVVERNEGDALQREEIDEFLFTLSRSQKTKAQERILEHLQSTVLTFSIKINRESLPEHYWEMLDALESYLAKKCDGLIYAPDDGFFDANLQHIYKF